MKPFRFCPSCASELRDAGDDEGGSRCPRCGRSWYRHSAPTVGCVIVGDGGALITRRGRDPEKGKFDVPGGFLRAGEDPIDGLKREIAEELNVEIDVSIGDVVQMVPHTYGEEGDYVLAIGFKARLAGGDPAPADDVAEVRWVRLGELESLEFAWPHDKELVERSLKEVT